MRGRSWTGLTGMLHYGRSPGWKSHQCGVGVETKLLHPCRSSVGFDTSQPIESRTVVPRCIYYLYLMPLYRLLPAGDVGMDKKETRRVSGK
jgi:hypothetical protein